MKNQKLISRNVIRRYKFGDAFFAPLQTLSMLLNNSSASRLLTNLENLERFKDGLYNWFWVGVDEKNIPERFRRTSNHQTTDEQKELAGKVGKMAASAITKTFNSGEGLQSNSSTNTINEQKELATKVGRELGRVIPSVITKVFHFGHGSKLDSSKSSRTSESQSTGTTTTTSEQEKIAPVITQDEMISEILAYIANGNKIDGINDVNDINKLEPWQILDVFRLIQRVYADEGTAPKEYEPGYEPKKEEKLQTSTSPFTGTTPSSVDLNRADVRAIMSYYGLDTTPSLRKAFRKYLGGDRSQDISFIDLNSNLHRDWIAPFVVFNKKGGRLVSKNVINRFKVGGYIKKFQNPSGGITLNPDSLNNDMDSIFVTSHPQIVDTVTTYHPQIVDNMPGLYRLLLPDGWWYDHNNKALYNSNDDIPGTTDHSNTIILDPSEDPTRMSYYDNTGYVPPIRVYFPESYFPDIFPGKRVLNLRLHSPNYTPAATVDEKYLYPFFTTSEEKYSFPEWSDIKTNSNLSSNLNLNSNSSLNNNSSLSNNSNLSNKKNVTQNIPLFYGTRASGRINNSRLRQIDEDTKAALIRQAGFKKEDFKTVTSFLKALNRYFKGQGQQILVDGKWGNLTLKAFELIKNMMFNNTSNHEPSVSEDLFNRAMKFDNSLTEELSI